MKRKASLRRRSEGRESNECKGPETGECLDSCSSSKGISVAGGDCEEGGWEQLRSVECSGRGRIFQSIVGHSKGFGFYLE